MKVALIETIVTKQVNSIRPGSLRADVIQSFGKPGDWSYGYSMADAPTWKYSDLEITFEQDVVSLIALYFSGRNAASTTGKEGAIVFAPSTLESFRKELAEESIQYESDKLLNFDSQVCLNVGKEVKVFFTEHGQKMHSLQIMKSA